MFNEFILYLLYMFFLVFFYKLYMTDWINFFLSFFLSNQRGGHISLVSMSNLVHF